MMTQADISQAPRQLAHHTQWLDKLWQCLFDGDAGGLMSPGQIRREHRDREHVRQIEMAAILQAEQELNGIHTGKKRLDDNGNLVDTPSVDLVATHKIIENSAIEQGLDIGLDSPAAMIRSVVKELSVRDLERSLNLRKIAILCESEILLSEPQPVSHQPVNAEWMTRWRESAENVFNPELQVLWARALILEVAQPGSFNLGVMAALLQLSVDDLEVVKIASKYAFPDFIFCGPGAYLSTDFHQGMFEIMEDLGLLSSAATTVSLASHSNEQFRLLLPCQNKALQIEHSLANKSLSLSVTKLTRIGKQMMKLCHSNADLAYLFDLGRTIKAQGYSVAIGDWRLEGSKHQFEVRLAL
ncbi:DUF2806 domain-containing protein [Oceanicoccus sagamiensis]|nr:DUF2806 domain-containing protein [Oceanicoccus sagamiensis]